MQHRVYNISRIGTKDETVEFEMNRPRRYAEYVAASTAVRTHVASGPVYAATAGCG